MADNICLTLCGQKVRFLTSGHLRTSLEMTAMDQHAMPSCIKI